MSSPCSAFGLDAEGVSTRIGLLGEGVVHDSTLQLQLTLKPPKPPAIARAGLRHWRVLPGRRVRLRSAEHPVPVAVSRLRHDIEPLELHDII